MISQSKIFTKKTIMILMLSFLTMFTGCTNANEGVYQIQVIRGQIARIIKPQDGWVNTLGTIGDEYFDFSTRSFTDKTEVNASTKDNAALKISIAITAAPIADDDSIKAQVRKFGLESDERFKNMLPILTGQVNTETKNAVNEYEAYSLLANQEKMQKRLVEALRPILKDQLYLNLESIQIIGRPDFLDDRIEQAASAVVANQKAKEAAEADLARARVEAEKKQVEAQTFSNPALFTLRQLELKLEIERARADGIKGHNGPLTIVNGTDEKMQIQLRGGN